MGGQQSHYDCTSILNIVAYLNHLQQRWRKVLSIASGIAGLISLTIEVYGISYKYIINGVRNANSSACRFPKELKETQSQSCSSVSRDSQEKTIKSKALGILAFCLRSIRKSNEYIDLLHKVRNKLKQKDRQAPQSRDGMKSLTMAFLGKGALCSG